MTSQAVQQETVIVRLKVDYGSALPGPGNTIKTISSTPTIMAPGDSKTFTFDYTEVAPNDGRRDTEVDVLVNGVSKGYDHQNDLWTVLPKAGVVTKQSVTYNSGQTQVQPGQVISAQISITNNGAAPVTPRFRVDIAGTGIFDTHLEGSWVTSPPATPGMALTITANSIPVPTDWTAGKQFHAFVILDGVNGDWDTSQLLTVSGGGGITITPGNLTGQGSIPVGGTTTLSVAMTSDGNASVSMRLDILDSNGNVYGTQTKTVNISAGRAPSPSRTFRQQAGRGPTMLN